MTKLMTREEYLIERIAIAGIPDIPQRMCKLVDVDNNYIASLEAQVAKLEKVVEKAAKLMNDSSGSCPMDMYDYCVFDADRCPTDCNYTLCWKTWLMEEK